MLHIRLNQSDGIPLYLQLLGQIKRLMVTGRLGTGDELPPVRVLAQQLLVNPSTVVRAYHELELAGLIYKRRGAGTYVSECRKPYSDAECQKILMPRADALVVEAKQMGLSTEQIVSLVAESATRLEHMEKKGRAE